MKLKDFLQRMEEANPYKYVYIGANTGFFFIGTVRDAVCGTADESAKYYNDIIRLVKKYEYTIEKYPAREKSKIAAIHASREAFRSAKTPLEAQIARIDFEKRKRELKAMQRSLENCKQLLTKKKAELIEFRPFLDREVIDVYNRRIVPPFGDIIIIEGKEFGDYWDYDEYVKGKK